ncbi:MAG: hypothetical protein R6U68_15285 [Desulfobacteraceae bacterium]
MAGKTQILFITAIMLLPILCSCVSSTRSPVSGKGSSRSDAAEEIARKINTQ